MSGEAWTGEERLALCPVCGAPRAHEDDLGCKPSHTLLRVAELEGFQEDGDEDVRVSVKGTPSQRTNTECPQPRGADHSTAAAYDMGCRCAPALAALRLRRARKDGKMPHAS